MEKKIIIKKIISVSTAIAVMLNSPFALDFAVKAMNPGTPADVHSAHKVCKNNEEANHKCNDQCKTEVTWEAWGDIEEEKTKLPDTAGNYYLAAEINVKDETKIPSNVTVSLCLNGHNITMGADNKCIFRVSGTLNLCDCQKKGKLTGVNSIWENYSGNTGDYVGGSPIFINKNGTFNMYSGIISGNRAKIGGGVYLGSGTKFNMFGGTISNNTAGLQGGGVNANGTSSGEAIFTMKGGKITDNKVEGYLYSDYPTWSNGGGILVCDRTEFIMTGGTISNNTAKGKGGGIACPYGYRPCEIKNAVINNNEAELGGGIFAGGELTMSSVTIKENTAAAGGGIFIGGTGDTTTKMSDVTISHNNAKNEGKHTAKGCGGGVCINYGTLEMESSTISDNTAALDGGGVYYYSIGELIINNGKDNDGKDNSEILRNTAKNGGGVYVANGETFTMKCGIISKNTATEKGGGVYNNGTLEIDGKVDITSNTGGNVYLPSGKTIKIGTNFDTDSDVGVTVQQPPTSCQSPLTISKQITSTAPDKVYSNGFTPNDDGCQIEYNTTEKVLKLTKHIPGTKGTSKDEDNHEIKCQYCEVKLTSAHDWVKGTKDDPDLTKAGTQHFNCSVCEKEKTEEIPILTNTEAWEKTGDNPPTLSAEGVYTYTNIEDPTYIVKITVPKLTDDTWAQKQFSQKPTLEKDGTYQYKSTVYGTIEVPVSKLSDTNVWTKTVDKYPTLTDAGKYIYKYKDEKYDNVTVAVPNLKDVTWTGKFTKEPTTELAGTYQYTSTVYGTVDVTVPNLSDTKTWSKAHTDPTEDNDGKDVYTSENYGSITIIITALGHTHEWGEWTLSTDPTIEDEGQATRTCTKDSSHTDKQSVPALSNEDTWKKVDFVTKPTLEGKGTYKFNNDLYGDVTAEIPALSDEKVWAKVTAECEAATETTTGKDVYNSIYGKVEVTIAQLNHTHQWGEWTLSTNPTVEAAGEATRTCTKDSSHTEKQPVPPLSNENTWKKVDFVTKPTLESKGTYKFNNTVYGNVTAEIPALSDENVWSKVTDECEAATETTTGKDVYGSVYGKVEVTIPVITPEESTTTTEEAATTTAPEETTTTTTAPEETTTTTAAPEETTTTTTTPAAVHVPIIPIVTEPAATTPASEEPSATTPAPEETSATTTAASVPTDETEPADTDFFPNISENSIEKMVEQKEDVPEAKLETPVKELLQAIMPTEKLKAIKETDDIKVILKLENASETVPNEDKQQVEAALREYANYTLGQYMDLTLSTMINSSEAKITNAKAPITIAFEVPKNIRKANRVFSVIRVHEGVRTMLNDLDNDPDTVTIETDKFSTYALVYTDKVGNPNTGVYVSIIPFAIAVTALGVLAIRKKSK